MRRRLELGFLRAADTAMAESKAERGGKGQGERPKVNGEETARAFTGFWRRKVEWQTCNFSRDGDNAS